MVLAVDQAKGRADLLKRSRETELIESAKAHGVEDEIGASVNDCA